MSNEQEKLTHEEIKSLKKLARVIDRVYASPWRLFGRGLLWGLATGLGATIILGLVLWFLAVTVGNLVDFQEVRETLNTVEEQLRSGGRSEAVDSRPPASTRFGEAG